MIVLNPLLHSQLRLAVMSMLMTVKHADFVYLREKTASTAGNLSVQLGKLSSAGYISLTKSTVGRRPCSIYAITPEGKQAFEDYVSALKSCLHL